VFFGDLGQPGIIINKNGSGDQYIIRERFFA